MDVETIVKERYSEGAKARQDELCCPVDYDASLLKALPDEILVKDYGCGDPSRYVKEGDTVLDLGSGGGKICYMAAQLTGPSGQVIGVDLNDDMLALARKYQAKMQEKLGGKRVEFLKGYIQNLALDVQAMETYLADHPVKTAHELTQLENWKLKQASQTPLIPDNSVDLVVSNCVLNLVSDKEKQQLIREIFRVLKPGGRVAISDIVSDKVIPAHLKQDAELWSGCISGAFHEHEFSHVFTEHGFQAICYDKWDEQPWQLIENIEFRSVTLTAVKPEIGAGLDKGHIVIYRGPFASVSDEEGNVYYRGERMAVTDKTCRLLSSDHYKECFVIIEPGKNIQAATASCCSPNNAESSCCG